MLSSNVVRGITGVFAVHLPNLGAASSSKLEFHSSAVLLDKSEPKVVIRDLMNVSEFLAPITPAIIAKPEKFIPLVGKLLGKRKKLKRQLCLDICDLFGIKSTYEKPKVVTNGSSGRIHVVAGPPTPLIQDVHEPTVVYTDASVVCGRAGIGVHFEFDITLNLSEPLIGKSIDNNYAEIVAVSMALEKLIGSENQHQKPVVVRTDSLVIVNVMEEKAVSVKFAELFEKLRKLTRSFSNGVKFEHVKGHSGVPGNVKAHNLARKAVKILIPEKAESTKEKAVNHKCTPVLSIQQTKKSIKAKGISVIKLASQKSKQKPSNDKE